MKVVRRVVSSHGNCGNAGLELLAEPLRAARRARQRHLPALAWASRAESKVASGPAIAGWLRGVDEAVVAQRVRPTQDPELGEPGEVAQLPGDRIDSALPRHAPGLVARVQHARERRRAAVAQGAGQRGAGQASGVNGWRLMRRLLHGHDRRSRRCPRRDRRTPRVCIVSPALADANNGNWRTASRWQRFLAPVCAVQVVGGVARRGRRARPADCPARAPLGRLDRALPPRRPRADRPGADRHGPVSRSRQGPAGSTFAGVCQPRSSCFRSVAPLRPRRRQPCPAGRHRPVGTGAARGRSPGDADFVAVGHLREEKIPRRYSRGALLA